MSETIVFFGSGPVAAESLAKLAEDFVVEAVITKPQPTHHKYEFPVLSLANKLGLRVLTPSNKAELTSLFEQKPVTSKLGVVIDYGILISKPVIDYFPLGIVNSHFSLLPRWRGPDPISFAILNGDHDTGVSLMLIVETLDKGPLLAQQLLALSPEATTPSLTGYLINLSHEMLIDTLPAYIRGEISPKEQPDTGAIYSRKLSKQDSYLDWQKPAIQLEREVRAFYEWPRSRTTFNGINVVVTQAHVIKDEGVPGDLWLSNKQLGICTSDGIFVIDKLIPAGKKEMPAQAFLAGYNISNN